MPNAKYIIEPTPFKLRSQSPLNETVTTSNEIVNVNKKKNEKNAHNIKNGTGAGIGVDPNNINTLTGMPESNVIADAEKLDVKKEQEAKGGYNNYLRNRSQSDNARIAAKSKFKLAKREKRQGEKAIKWNKKTDVLTGNMVGKVTQTEADRIVGNSPVAYSVANPFNPSQQDLVGQVYNPGGNDINQFQQNQSANKVTYGQPNPASNPNTYNQPAIPTEADTTMNDLQMGNAPMGDDLSGGMMPTTGLAPEQGMGSTQFGGVNTNPTIDLRRQQNRSTRQANRADKKAKRISDREYRSTGYRSGAMGGAILPQGN